MNKIVVIIFILIFTQTFPLWSQGNSTSYGNEDNAFNENIFFVEAGGNGILLSMNYERLLKYNLGIRIGVGSLGFFGLTIPTMLNYYIGKERKLELGFGLTYIDYFPKKDDLISNGKFLVVGTIGHKYQRESGGVILRFSFTPVYSPNSKKIIPFGGISVGYAFN